MNYIDQISEENKEQIMKFNKLMAEYMGYKYYPHNYVSTEHNKKCDAGWKKHERVSDFVKYNINRDDYLCRDHNSLSFHSNWNWNSI